MSEILNSFCRSTNLLFCIFFFLVNFVYSQNINGIYYFRENNEEIHIINDSTLFYSIYKEDTNRIVKCYFDTNEEGLLNLLSFEEVCPQLFKNLFRKDSTDEHNRLFLGNTIDSWHSGIEEIYLYKNNIEVAFSYNSNINFQNLDSTYSFSIRSIDSYYGYKKKFQIKDFRDLGNSFFIETEPGSDILNFNLLNRYYPKLYEDLKTKQIFIKNDSIEIYQPIIMKTFFEKVQH